MLSTHELHTINETTALSIEHVYYVGLHCHPNVHRPSANWWKFADIVSVDIVSVDLVSVDIVSVDIVSVDLVSVDIVSVDIVSVDLMPCPRMVNRLYIQRN